MNPLFDTPLVTPISATDPARAAAATGTGGRSKRHY